MSVKSFAFSLLLFCALGAALVYPDIIVLHYFRSFALIIFALMITLMGVGVLAMGKYNEVIKTTPALLKDIKNWTVGRATVNYFIATANTVLLCVGGNYIMAAAYAVVCFMVGVKFSDYHQEYLKENKGETK